MPYGPSFSDPAGIRCNVSYTAGFGAIGSTVFEKASSPDLCSNSGHRNTTLDKPELFL